MYWLFADESPSLFYKFWTAVDFVKRVRIRFICNEWIVKMFASKRQFRSSCHLCGKGFVVEVIGKIFKQEVVWKFWWRHSQCLWWLWFLLQCKRRDRLCISLSAVYVMDSRVVAGGMVRAVWLGLIQVGALRILVLRLIGRWWWKLGWIIASGLMLALGFVMREVVIVQLLIILSRLLLEITTIRWVDCKVGNVSQGQLLSIFR